MCIRDRAYDGALHRVVLLVDEAGHAAEAGRGDEVHEEAPDAGVADGDHLDEGHDERHGGGGHGAVDKAAYADDDVLEVKVQEAVDAGHELRQEHDDVGDGGYHGEGREFLCVHLVERGGLFCCIHFQCTSYKD